MLLIFVGMTCFFPLALYFLFLAALHHRTRPTFIPGTWDAIAMLLGLSGFLLVGGTVLIFSLDRTVREFWLHGGTLREWAVLHAQANFLSQSVWIAYLGVVIGTTWYAVRSRRADTVLYQITPPDLERLLPYCFERLNLVGQRRGDVWTWSANVSSAPTREGQMASPGSVEGRFTVDGSELMRVAVIHWENVNCPDRSVIEGELCRILADVRVPPSPLGIWFLTATTVIFMAIALLLGAIFFGASS